MRRLAFELGLETGVDRMQTIRLTLHIRIIARSRRQIPR